MSAYQLLVYDARNRAEIWRSQVETTPVPAISKGDDWLVPPRSGVVESVGHQIVQQPDHSLIYQTLVAVLPR